MTWMRLVSTTIVKKKGKKCDKPTFRGIDDVKRTAGTKELKTGARGKN